jgi:serine/threonine protein kinase
MSPECFANPKSGYYQNCDTWSLGVILFELATGAHPLVDDITTLGLALYRIYDGVASVHLDRIELFKSAPAGLRNLIEKMLIIDKELRPTVNELLLKNEWLREQVQKHVLNKKQYVWRNNSLTIVFQKLHNCRKELH